MTSNNYFTINNTGSGSVLINSKDKTECAQIPCETNSEGNKTARKKKPKQSTLHKIDRLLKNNPIPNTLASAALQLSKRYLAGNLPANSLEAAAFGRLAKLLPEEKKLLAKNLRTIEELPTDIRSRLFNTAVLTTGNQIVEPEAIKKAFENELSELVNRNSNPDISEDDYCNSGEKAGQVRLTPNAVSDDIYTNQVHVFRINNLRTDDFLPKLNEQDYIQAELQGGEPCLGSRVGNSCLRVVKVSVGEMVYLEGVNFFNTQAFVRLTSVTDVTRPAREVDAWVCGDTTTPLTETINGQTIVIADSRVHDRLRFSIPMDLRDGIYRFEVIVPNNSGMQGPGLGTLLTSNSQYLQVLATDNSLFKITCEEIWCQKETSPAWWGSDEIDLSIDGFEYPETFFPNNVEGVFKQFEDMDSDEKRSINQIVYANKAGIPAHSLKLAGYEHDSDQPNRLMRNYDDAMMDIIKIIVGSIFVGLGAALLIAGGSVTLSAAGIPILIATGSALVIPFALLSILVGGSLIYMGIDLLAARWWGPADRVIDDWITLRTQDFAELTDMQFPAPPIYPEIPAYTTENGIEVRRISSTKDASGYTEERQYISDDEDSRYVIRLKYTRVN